MTDLNALEVEKKHLEADITRISNDIGEMAAIRNMLNDKIKTLNADKAETQEALIRLLELMIKE